MSAEETEDSVEDNVHHYDFTTASAWEIFIARIEELIYQWKLSTAKKKSNWETDSSSLVWKVTTEEVVFADAKFTVSWYKAECSDLEETDEWNLVDESMCYSRDFHYTPYHVHFYYGLSEFIILDPLNVSVSHSKLNILISALFIAVTNAQCNLPFFVKALDPKQNFYVGIASNLAYRANFDMVDLKKIPQQCQHLTGLTHIFKSNLKRSSKDVLVSVRLSYQLKNWTSFLWSKESTDADFSNLENMDVACKLPVGCRFEPIAWLSLRAIWQGLPEGSIVDGPGYSDLDPCQAPKWVVSIGKTDITACLTEFLIEFTYFCSFSGTNEELIGDLMAQRRSSDFEKPFRSLTESRIPRLSELLFSDSIKRSFEEPIQKNDLFPILHYLFPDTDRSKKFPYKVDGSDVENRKFKTCSEDSLIWRLSLVMAHILHSFGGPRAAAHLWLEFCQEIRFRWNSSTLIPGISLGRPDTKTCLLHQKLQMINYCIQRKLEREKDMLNKQESEDSDEEFYDAESDEMEGRPSAWSLPAGRLRKHPTLRLLKTNQPLYEPKRQPFAVKTEDQEEEDINALLSLGDSPESSQTRLKLQAPMLLTDMESFKAANPGAEFEDFIRWHSPSDWIEKEDENGALKGQLSPRMTFEGNEWKEVWAAAHPVPLHRQKQLFDETTEAEKALHLIESATPADAAAFLLPTVIHAALNTLSEQVSSANLDQLSQGFEKIEKKVQIRTRCNAIDVSAYMDLVTEMHSVECILAQIKSLSSKFGDSDQVDKFVGDLVLGSCPEVEIPGGPNSPIANKVKAMFIEAYRVEQMLEKEEEEQKELEFGHVVRPDAKDFVLRIRDGDSAHRLTACLSHSRITMASLTTQPALLV